MINKEVPRGEEEPLGRSPLVGVFCNGVLWAAFPTMGAAKAYVYGMVSKDNPLALAHQVEDYKFKWRIIRFEVGVISKHGGPDGWAS